MSQLVTTTLSIINQFFSLTKSCNAFAFFKLNLAMEILLLKLYKRKGFYLWLFHIYLK